MTFGGDFGIGSKSAVTGLSCSRTMCPRTFGGFFGFSTESNGIQQTYITSGGGSSFSRIYMGCGGTTTSLCGSRTRTASTWLMRLPILRRAVFRTRRRINGLGTRLSGFAPTFSKCLCGCRNFSGRFWSCRRRGRLKSRARFRRRGTTRSG